MSRDGNRTKRVTKLLKWIHQYSGWWYLICTPNDEHMSPQMMKLLIERLAKEDFYEIIIALLMVHRNEEFMKGTFGALFLDMLIVEIRNGKGEAVIKRLIDHLE